MICMIYMYVCTYIHVRRDRYVQCVYVVRFYAQNSKSIQKHTTMQNVSPKLSSDGTLFCISINLNCLFDVFRNSLSSKLVPRIVENRFSALKLEHC